MHDAAMPPRPVEIAPMPGEERARLEPPPGWKGTYQRCGGCGDFLKDHNPCPACTPQAPAPPQNMMIATPAVMK
jgi:hypothetical protein